MRLPPYGKASIASVLGVWSVAACLTAMLAALVIIPVGGDLPGYAMDSTLLFRLERGLAIAVILVLPALVIGPLLSGTLPQKLSSDGIDWEEDRANVVNTLDDVNMRLDKLEDALNKITGLNDS